MSQQTASDSYRIGIGDIEAEHAMQYMLLVEAERLLNEGDIVRAHEVVEHLLTYSDAHFASEQVLMRLHSYPGYQSHLREHGELLGALKRLETEIASENAAAGATAIRKWLMSHIQNSDQAFVDHIREAPLSPEPPDQQPTA